MHIRQATINDLKTIQKLNHQLFKLEKENYDPTLIADWPLSQIGKDYFEDMINNKYVVVATSKDVIIGYLAGAIKEKCTYTSAQYGEIENMFIESQYRDQGVGKALISYFKKYCIDKNIHNLKVLASAKNKAAQEFYKNIGFDDFEITLTMSIE
jgi:N-acetylglutamate synthase-like GNAT family acetyltransferase